MSEMQDWTKLVGGMKMDEPDPRDYKPTEVYSAISLPEEYNANPTNHVHNQGSINSCAAHALCAFVEIVLNSKNAYKKMSYPFYYGDRNYTTYKGQGLITRDLLKAAQKDGGVYLTDFSYDKEMTEIMTLFNQKFSSLKRKAQNIRINNYYSCTTAQQVKEAIYKYGSCLVGATLFESFENVASGKTLYMNEPIITYSKAGAGSIEKEVGSHMMLAVGWIKDYFIIQNSWGESFGKNGYFYMPMSIFTWNERTGCPIIAVNAWAVDGVYLNGTLITANTNDTPEPVVIPDSKDRWYKKNGYWRYTLENGNDATGWQTIDNAEYYFESNGNMASSKWISVSSKWKYLKGSGAAAKEEWQKIGSAWYWFDTDKYAVTGWKTIKGVDYYFAEKDYGKIKQCQCMELSK